MSEKHTIDPGQYEAIIFDLGGVIINIDYQLTIQAFEALGVENFKEQYSKKTQSNLFDLLETGKISQVEFVHNIQQSLGLKHVSSTEIISAWNALLLDFPKKRLEMLTQLHQDIPIFLLSNTNAIHVSAFHEILYSTHGIKNLNRFFNKVYFSHEIGMRKPHSEVFEYVLEEQGLKAANTLFIDDSIQHIIGAKQVGLQAFHIREHHEITSLINHW